MHASLCQCELVEAVLSMSDPIVKRPAFARRNESRSSVLGCRRMLGKSNTFEPYKAYVSAKARGIL